MADESERVRNPRTDLTEAGAERRRVQACLVAIANAVHRIAGDLAAFGPYAFERVASVERRVSAAAAELLALQNELRQQRDDYVAAQLQRLGIGPDAVDLRLNIGAGRFRLDSWINIDMHPADLALDARWGLGLPDGSARWVRLSHVLEHLYYPGEVEQLLREIRRVLVRGGVVRIIVPDIEKCLRAYAEGDAQFFEDRRNTWTRAEAHTPLEFFLQYAGASPNPGSFLSSHKFGYDFQTLEYILRRAGFAHVERSDYMQSRHDTLRVDDMSRVAGAKSGARYYSLFVEASG